MGGNICFLFLEVSAGSHLYKVRHVIASATLFLLVSTRVDGATLQSSDALASLLIGMQTLRVAGAKVSCFCWQRFLIKCSHLQKRKEEEEEKKHSRRERQHQGVSGDLWGGIVSLFVQRAWHNFFSGVLSPHGSKSGDLAPFVTKAGLPRWR